LPIDIVDIAIALGLAVERSNSAMLSRTDTISSHVKDIYTQHAPFTSTLMTLDNMGRASYHDVELIFIGRS
jgi:hypothetical protein